MKSEIDIASSVVFGSNVFALWIMVFTFDVLYFGIPSIPLPVIEYLKKVHGRHKPADEMVMNKPQLSSFDEYGRDNRKYN